jgi:hypothetical protein
VPPIDIPALQQAVEPLYVSCAFDGELAYIVTVHWYDASMWVDP